MPEDPELQTQVDELFEKKLTQHHTVLQAFASYISSEKKHDLTHRFLTTEMKIDFHAFLPYLDRQDLRVLGCQLIQRDCINGLTLKKALPFLYPVFKDEIKARQNI